MGTSEGYQSIYRMHSPVVKTEHGNRSMTAMGTIKGLEIDKAANYVLIPSVHGNKTMHWEIFKIHTDCDVEPETWDNLCAETDKELQDLIKNNSKTKYYAISFSRKTNIPVTIILDGPDKGKYRNGHELLDVDDVIVRKLKEVKSP